MKKFIICCFICFMILVPGVIHGQSNSNNCTNTPSDTLCNPIRYSSDSIEVFVFRLVAILTSGFALVALVMVIFSGFRMIISQGNEEALTAAKSSLQWAIGGLIIGMFAFIIIYSVGDFIGARNLNPDSYDGNDAVINPLFDPTLKDLLSRLITGFLSLVGTLAILMIVVGGFRYMTSAGNEEQVESGKKTLQWAIIGLITVILSYVLVRASLTFFGG